jgi:hypothetical protein
MFFRGSVGRFCYTYQKTVHMTVYDDLVKNYSTKAGQMPWIPLKFAQMAVSKQSVVSFFLSKPKGMTAAYNHLINFIVNPQS